MNESQKALSDLTVHNKYARYLSKENRRETWFEIVDRYLRMMIQKYGTAGDVLNWDYYHSKKKDVTWLKFLSPIATEIVANGQYLYRKDVLPSMRAAQFAGVPVTKNNSRIYNCAFLPIDDKAAFSEVMFLLLGGTGVGYSVQYSHVAKLPKINKSDAKRKFLIGDSIEGWADSIKALMYWGFGLRSQPVFDYSDIRDKGALLITAGGKAPGPAPLRVVHNYILQILENKKNGSKLTSIEVHDIICHIADSVLAGGIRRAALISLFSADDDEMMQSKSGDTVTVDKQTSRGFTGTGEFIMESFDIEGTYNGLYLKGIASQYDLDNFAKTSKMPWYVFNGQRGRANNSAVLLRHRVTKPFFDKMWSQISNSYSGEPGIYFSNDINWGTNPCVEIALRPFQFCNLTEINAGSIKEAAFTNNGHGARGQLTKAEYAGLEQVELNNRARVASFFGTLQAGFTDFHYLRDIWRTTTEKDSLIGVGMTGIASGDTFNLDLYESSQIVVEENKRVALLIGINPAARTTTIKPSGTTSIVVGSSSGIHAWFAKYYLRSIQTAVDSELAKYFFEYHPKLIKVMQRDAKSAVIGIPQMAPEGAVLGDDENAIQMLERVFKYYNQWVKPGHQSGNNTNNVSATVYVDRTKKYDKTSKGLLQFPEGSKDEWEVVGEYLWEHREEFNGMAVLPYDGGDYLDAPFQRLTKEQFDLLYPLIHDIDLSKVREMEDNTDLSGELACAGSNCEIK